MDIKPPRLSFDIERNCAALGISREIYLRILNKALEQTRADIAQMQAALAASNIDQIQAISHRLKGDYANLHVECLAEIAARLNNESRTDKNPENMNRYLGEFTDCFEGITRFINAPGS